MLPSPRKILERIADGPARVVWGQPIVYRVGSVAAVTIRGILDEAWVSVSQGGDVPVDALHPVLDVRLADLGTAPAQGDLFRDSSSGQTYRVTAIQPDGHGGARLIAVRETEEAVSAYWGDPTLTAAELTAIGPGERVMYQVRFCLNPTGSNPPVPDFYIYGPRQTDMPAPWVLQPDVGTDGSWHSFKQFYSPPPNIEG